jgi:predicted transcriptional regulator
MWTFLTSHAQVLLCIWRNNQMTAREIALIVGITERNVQRIVRDLEEAGYISRLRDGRRNTYEIHAHVSMRHPEQQGRSVQELLELLGGKQPKPSKARKTRSG